MENKKAESFGDMNRSCLYAAGGFFVGIFAPIAWMLLRLVLFWQEGQPAVSQVLENITRSEESVALYLFMGIGTALVLGAFGFFMGRSSQQIHGRARRLDELNRDVELQKELFQSRFEELNANIKNLNSINSDIQKSLDVEEVLRLAADGLHGIMGFDRVNILMLNDEKTELSSIVTRGGDGGNENAGSVFSVPYDERSGTLFKAVKEKRLYLVEDISYFPEAFRLRSPFDSISQLRSKSFVVCPIIINDGAVGLLSVDNKSKKRKMLDTDADTVKIFADQVSSALTKINLLETTETLIRELENTFQQLPKFREEHSRVENSLKEAMDSNGQTIANVAAAAGVVRGAVDTTRSAVTQISASLNQLPESFEHLSDFIDKSNVVMREIAQTVKSIRENSSSSHSMYEKVKEKAELGAMAVNNTLKGLVGISGAVDGTFDVISHLCEKGEQIGGITGVINEITQRTNLLALNASIIAAQAGEHGKSFAVVADEVRTLSLEAANSTNAIAKIIDEIQNYSREAEGHIGKTRNLVKEGLALGEDMEASLGDILDSSSVAIEMSRDIRVATGEVVDSVDFVSSSIEDLRNMAATLTRASNEQAQGTQSIVQSVDEIKDMSDDMVKATEKQLENAKNIEKSVNDVGGMAKYIFDQLEERKRGSHQVIENLERLKRGSRKAI